MLKQLLSLTVILGAFSAQAATDYNLSARNRSASEGDILEAVCRIKAREAADQAFRSCRKTQLEEARTEKSLKDKRSAGKAIPFDEDTEMPEPIPAE